MLVNKKAEFNPFIVIFCFVFIFLLIMILIAGFDTVKAGHVGVRETFGDVNHQEINSGLHWTGVFTRTIDISTQIQKVEYVAGAASKDLQTVTTGVAINYRIKSERASELYTELGLSYTDRIIQPMVQEAVKSQTAKYTAEELITKRESVKQDITQYMITRLENKGLDVTEVSITDFQFSEQFDQAIEAKVQAEQEALKAERELQRIKVEAEQKVTQAQAEADSLKVQRQEITEQLLELRKIENQKLMIEKWDGVMPTVINGNGGLILDIGDLK